MNEAFVRSHFGDANPVGRRLKLGWGGDDPKEVVGVVGDVRHRSLGDETRPEMYVPQAQFPNAGITLLVRTRSSVESPEALSAAIPEKCWIDTLSVKDERVTLSGVALNNYTIATDVQVDHLLVCEVVTPGGNWSSYPPHKHDEHGDDERVLEEIYYFEVADGPSGPGVGYHRTYGTPDRPIEVFTEVRTGDTALVPHGFHGPCMAAPGYDLYYLNVMAGPAEDGRWLATDDPAVAWVRDTWPAQAVDPRLPVPAPEHPTHDGADDDAPTHRGTR